MKPLILETELRDLSAKRITGSSVEVYIVDSGEKAKVKRNGGDSQASGIRSKRGIR